MNVIDYIPAFSIEVNDQIIVEGDPIEVSTLPESDDVDKVIVHGYSYVTGDLVDYTLDADDMVDVWSA